MLKNCVSVFVLTFVAKGVLNGGCKLEEEGVGIGGRFNAVEGLRDDPGANEMGLIAVGEGQALDAAYGVGGGSDALVERFGVEGGA